MLQVYSIAALFFAIVVAILLLIVFYSRAITKPKSRDGFWTQYGSAVEEQVRRVDAAEKGVPDMPWAEAYVPPNFCGAHPPPVKGEPQRPPFDSKR